MYISYDFICVQLFVSDKLSLVLDDKYREAVSTCHYYFMCPSDGDVKSEVPYSVSATPVHVKDPLSSSSLFGISIYIIIYRNCLLYQC
jgi:hypothetical protein